MNDATWEGSRYSHFCPVEDLFGSEVTRAAQRSGSVASHAHLLLERGRAWMGPLVGRAVTEHPGWRAELAHIQPELDFCQFSPRGHTPPGALLPKHLCSGEL